MREFVYPDDSACAGHPEPWIFDGKAGNGKVSPRQRRERHARALAVCATCPVTAECDADVDIAAGDEGVRGGRVLPKNNKVGGYGDVQGASRKRKAS